MGGQPCICTEGAEGQEQPTPVLLLKDACTPSFCVSGDGGDSSPSRTQQTVAEAMRRTGRRRGIGATTVTEVWLHVYDLGNSKQVQMLNMLLKPLGMGMFHCGVEVHGVEWSFCGTPDVVTGSGVFCIRPLQCADHNFHESVMMGRILLSQPSVLGIAYALRKEWRAEQYDILRCNCCHFCDALCQRLGVRAVPEWVMRLATAGSDVLEVGCCASRTPERMPRPLSARSALSQSEQEWDCVQGPAACPPGHQGGWETSDVEIVAEDSCSQHGRLRLRSSAENLASPCYTSKAPGAGPHDAEDCADLGLRGARARGAQAVGVPGSM